jgi:hypothetical protein
MSDAAEYPEVQARINATRAELDSTLASIEDKLDVKKHLTRLSEQGQAVYVRYSEQGKTMYTRYSEQGKTMYTRYSDQGKTLFTRYRQKAEASYREKPVPWIVGATAIGITVLGTVAWAIFSDD